MCKKHLVAITGCNDCHTPKKMGPHGPENDMSLMLSGHPAQQPPAAFDVHEAAKRGLIVTQTFTAAAAGKQNFGRVDKRV